MKRLRIFAALLVAFGSLFFATPAQADTFIDWSRSYNTAYDASTDCVIFSYTWGSASKVYPVNDNVQNVHFEITVNNSNTNKIGGNGEVFDSYSIEMQLIDAGVVVDTATYAESSTKHFAETRGLTSTYSGHVDSVNITLRGIDNGYWGGYYGPVMCGPALTVSLLPQSTPTSTPATPTPTDTPVEPSPTPTVVPEPTPTDSPTPQQPQFPHNSVHGNADEGWDLTLTAPDGYVFDSVYFASYGVPENYTAQWCDASTSVEKVAEVFIGQATGTIASNNGVFGDPCGGTYKRLQVVLTYRLIVPIVVPTPEPPVEPSPTPTPTPTETPSPLPEPEVTPTPSPEPQPSPTPEPTPTTEPTPDPTPTEEPTIPPTPEETVEPTPEPTLPPEEEPAPAPEETKEPVVEPDEVESEPLPEPEPPSSTEEPAALIEDLISSVEDPTELTEAQVEQLVEAAEEVLATAEQGSPEYQEALEALAVAAEADDLELPEELAAVPVVGEVLGAALEVFNDLGNVGADMAPAVREEAQKTVVASVIATGAAVQATVAAATSAASAAMASSAPSGGAASSSASTSQSPGRKK